MKKFVFSYYGRKILIHHSFPEKKFLQLYTNWMYKGDKTLEEFIEHINTRSWHYLLGWRAEVIKEMHTV